jgi:hypothetical protein
MPSANRGDGRRHPEGENMSGRLRYAVLVLVLASAAVPSPGAAGEPDLEGLYESTGLNPDGSAFRGFARIDAYGESFRVTWMFLDPSTRAMLVGPVAFGVGVRNGEALAVSYHSHRTSGVVLYTIERGGHRLVGKWTAAGDDGDVYVETLTRLPATAAASGLPEDCS